jgi:hypothetical protein
MPLAAHPKAGAAIKTSSIFWVNTMIYASNGYTGQVAKLIDASAKVVGGFGAISSARIARLRDLIC